MTSRMKKKAKYSPLHHVKYKKVDSNGEFTKARENMCDIKIEEARYLLCRLLRVSNDLEEIQLEITQVFNFYELWFYPNDK